MKLISVWGNSVTEYLLPIAFIGLLLLVSLPLLSTSFKNASPGMFEASSKPSQPNSMAVKKMGKMPYTQDMELTLSDGTSITLEEFPTNSGKLVELLGGNGTTEVMLAQMLQLADKLFAEGKLTQTQYNQFKDLANQGHTISNIEALVEKRIQAAKSDRSVIKQPIAFSGKTYANLADLTHQQLNWCDGCNAAGNNKELYSFLKSVGYPLRGDTETVGGAVYPFLSLYKSLYDSGAMKEPAVKNTMTYLVSQIDYMADLTANASHRLTIEQNSSPEQEVQRMASDVSHYRSGEICGKKDTGVHCL